MHPDPLSTATARSDQEIALPERRDRPVTLMHRVEYCLAILLFFVFRLIGIDASSWIAGKFMRTIGPLLRSVSRRAEDNLTAAFPDWSGTEVMAVTKEVWENLGRTAAEFAHLEKLNSSHPSRRVTIDPSTSAQVEKIIAAGQPVILVSGHFANWEIMSISVHELGFDYGVVYRAANNPLVDELIIKERAKVMTRLQIPKGKRGGRQLIEVLRSKKSLAMLVDQKLNDGIAVPLFGREAMTPPAAARLSLKFKAPIVAIEIERHNGAHFTVRTHPAIDFTPTGDTNVDVYNLTLAVNQSIEQTIRTRPGQWLWLHRRWPKQ